MNKKENGMCPPMQDKDFFHLLTRDSKGIVDHNMVDIAVKYYPELEQYSVHSEE